MRQIFETFMSRLNGLFLSFVAVLLVLLGAVGYVVGGTVVAFAQWSGLGVWSTSFILAVVIMLAYHTFVVVNLVVEIMVIVLVNRLEAWVENEIRREDTK